MTTGINDRKLILENGQEYYGKSFGSTEDKVCEIVFNTSMAGYQEIVSDPSYTYQAVVMTYPLIGNYGCAADDYETETPTIGALIVREYCREPSNFRCEKTLETVLQKYGIPGISGIDTRKLTRAIRDHGSQKALITSVSCPLKKGLDILKSTPLPADAVRRVSCRTARTYQAKDELFHIAAIDCGMKLNIIRSLLKRGVSVTVLPYNVSHVEIEALKPDGIFISNGPGDPTDVPDTISTIKALIGKYPVFGICLGHQIISLACGARTYKLKFGHRGGNHPVRDLKTGKIAITSQNHSYAVDEKSLSGTLLKVTHINLLDGTVEGAASEKDMVFGVQYHPESSPGPHDSSYLFDRFTEMMRKNKNA